MITTNRKNKIEKARKLLAGEQEQSGIFLIYVGTDGKNQKTGEMLTPEEVEGIRKNRIQALFWYSTDENGNTTSPDWQKYYGLK